MSRLLAGATLIVMLALPGAVSPASASDRAASLTDADLSARRCVCAYRTSHVRLVRRHSKRVAVRLPLRLGYDPLPYRFGYRFPPYRYIDRYAVVRVRSSVYR
jgi:hypothetical protein